MKNLKSAKQAVFTHRKTKYGGKTAFALSDFSNLKVKLSKHSKNVAVNVKTLRSSCDWTLDLDR